MLLIGRNFKKGMNNIVLSPMAFMASRITREAETAYFATEGYPLLMVTRFTPNPQKSVFKTATLQLVLERPDNLDWEIPALLRQYALELRPVLLDPLIKQRVLWRVSLIVANIETRRSLSESIFNTHP